MLIRENWQGHSDDDKRPQVDNKRPPVGKVTYHDFRAQKRVKSEEPAGGGDQVEEEQEEQVEQEKNLLCTTRVL